MVPAMESVLCGRKRLKQSSLISGYGVESTKLFLLLLTDTQTHTQTHDDGIHRA